MKLFRLFESIVFSAWKFIQSFASNPNKILFLSILMFSFVMVWNSSSVIVQHFLAVGHSIIRWFRSSMMSTLCSNLQLSQTGLSTIPILKSFCLVYMSLCRNLYWVCLRRVFIV